MFGFATKKCLFLIQFRSQRHCPMVTVVASRLNPDDLCAGSVNEGGNWLEVNTNLMIVFNRKITTTRS